MNTIGNCQQIRIKETEREEMIARVVDSAKLLHIIENRLRCDMKIKICLRGAVLPFLNLPEKLQERTYQRRFKLAFKYLNN